VLSITLKHKTTFAWLDFPGVIINDAVGGNSFSLAHIPSLGYRFQIGAVKQIAT
jgi:hypothetical protein